MAASGEPFGVPWETMIRQLKRFLGHGSCYKGGGFSRFEQKQPAPQRFDGAMSRYSGGTAHSNAVRRSDHNRKAGLAYAGVTQGFGNDLRADAGRISEGDGDAGFIANRGY